MKENNELVDLENFILAIQMACKTISNLIHRAGLVYSIHHDDNNGGGAGDVVVAVV